MTKLQAYKTYLMGTLAIIYGVSGYFLGHLEVDMALNTIWAGITTLTVRSAIK